MRHTPTNIDINTLLNLSIVFLSILAWVTSIFYNILHMNIILLVVGTFIAPVGILHGLGLWLGVL